MNLSSLITDNITELLVKIIEFTEIRQKILTRNINEMHNFGFVPEDLEIDEFCRSLHYALAEHVQSQRLILCDTENIKFGTGGCLDARPIIDRQAKELLENNPDDYLVIQVDKLLENSLNQRVAAELLKQKQGLISIFE